MLEQKGFNLIDTNVIFEKKIDKSKQFSVNKNIRLAAPKDRDKVVKLASTNFSLSRFHLDPLITNELANNLKGLWIKNYFKGIRGDKMFVQVQGNKVVGFLQILKNNNKITIDLIAVEKTHQKKKIATNLINFAETNYSDCFMIQTGTQIANINSIKLYQKHGFYWIDSYYIFHYHNF